PTDNDDPVYEEKDTKALVISPLGDLDPVFFSLEDGFETSYVKSLSELEEGTTLNDFEVVLLSNKLTEDKDELRKQVAYFPMVNLSTELIKAWGLGTVADSETNSINVSDENSENALYNEITIDGGLLELIADGVLPVVTPDSYLANDKVLATIGEGEAAVPYILQHTSTSGNNTHILIPLGENSTSGDQVGDNLGALVRNALKMAAKTKKAVAAATKPDIAIEQENLSTTVTITSKQAEAGAVIRYTTDGSDPTAESAVYSEPLKFTEPLTVKAYVDGVDGFTASAVSSAEVKISAKADAPEISYKAGEDGKSTVITITSNMADAEIHYSFKGQSEESRRDAAKTAKYEEPLVVTEPTQVFAFVTGKDLLPSELTKMNISIPGVNASNIRLDKVSHFTAADSWHPGQSNPAYVGKTADAEGTPGTMGFGGSGYKAYSSRIVVTPAVKEQAKNEDGSLKVDEEGNPVKEVVTPAENKDNP
ncbi:MAG: chitobiase/beta-hexosaminidase C-terminal domain-containing protein, partial [Duncaniella sp.]|nr:chitobiase/beta-hexosaminidase C-terminal domain-containing protein [Duncaniella sp.]